MSTLCRRKIISFDDVTLGEFVVWLFNFAEEQNDEDFALCHLFYDWLVNLYLDEQNPHYSDRDAIDLGNGYYEYYED